MAYFRPYFRPALPGEGQDVSYGAGGGGYDEDFGNGAGGMEEGPVNPFGRRDSHPRFNRFESERGRPSGRGNQRGGRRDHGEISVFSNRELEIMEEKTVNDNVFFLSKNFKKLEETLEASNARPERVERLLRIFSRMCQSKTLSVKIQKIMSTIAQSGFFLGQTASYLSRADTNPERSVVDILSIFLYLLNNSPTAFHGVVTLMVPRIRLLVVKGRIAKSGQHVDELEKVQLLHEALTEKITRGEDLEEDKLQHATDDFIGQPILPNVEDIGPESEPPNLKENIVKGKYKSPFHYLDTQFRLLREDLIGPLRLGVKQYREISAQGKEVTKLDDGYCYNGVRLLGVESRSRGLACRVQFDISKMKRIRWESSKRLLQGNLVCLSADNFESIICATVEERKTEMLAKGEIILRLESGLLTMMGEKRSWAMIESVSYLESYKHVLIRLQELGDDVNNDVSLPFQRYFLSCRSVVEPPKYLTTDPVMDFRTLFNTWKHVDLDDSAIPLHRRLEELDRRAEKREVNVLSEEEWDKLKDLDLDRSQLEALKNALTHELSVIQGPPGTGKTFIGLKVVELLLANGHLWKRMMRRRRRFLDDVYLEKDEIGDLEDNEEDCGDQIMVMCYTNHALDQFLEGILDLQCRTPPIVRVGGRCVNERLAQYTLRKQRHTDCATWAALDAVRQEIKSLDTKLVKLMRSFNVRNPSLGVKRVLKSAPPTQMHQFNVRGATRVMALVVWLVGGDPNYVRAKRYEKLLNQIQVSKPAGVKQKREKAAEGSESFLEDLTLLEEDVSLLHEEREMDDEDWLSIKSKVNSREEGHEWYLPMELQAAMDMLEPMDVELAEDVNNIWALNVGHRQALYLHWCSSYLENQDIKIQIVLQDLRNKYEELDEISKEVDFEVLRKSEIIGVTTTGAAKYHDLIQRVRPKIVIVEEAAEVLEAHIVTALTENCEHLVLIGDHKQLRPSPTMFNLAREYNLDISLFERMVRNNMPVSTLEYQHRMRPEISQFLVPHIYEELKDHEVVFKYDSVTGVGSDVVFMNHAVKEDGEEDTRSHTNEHEAHMVVELCSYLLKQGYRPNQITVLTLYSGQMFQIRRRMRGGGEFHGIRVVPVDNFQGEENDIIILSFVRSNDAGKLGFLKAPNRVCVSLSRAKQGFYAFGNFTMFAKKSNIWKGIIMDAISKNVVKSHIPLVCQNHGTLTKVSTPADFENVRSGGCSKACEFRLSCGHVCAQLCHPHDPGHEEYVCQKSCQKPCINGHNSCTQKCFEDCDRCLVEITVTKEPCGHSYATNCFKGDRPCILPCPKTLPCGHPCDRTCGSDCTASCLVIVTEVRPCTHEYVRKCHEPVEDQCMERCLKMKECGHPCEKMCGQACESQITCNEKVTTRLTCGHERLMECSLQLRVKKGSCSFLDCTVRVKLELACGHEVNVECCKKDEVRRCHKKVTVELACGHSCSLPCHEATRVKGGNGSVFSCKEKVKKTLPCGHEKLVECHEDVRTAFCSIPCDERLQCGHTCPGNCTKCRVIHMKCNKRCKKRLICTHTCSNKCSEPCGACDVKSEFRCAHKVFQKEKCSTPKTYGQCELACSLYCPHSQCTKRCLEMCDREPCNEPCPRRLQCNHPCLGLCGEPCPVACAKCRPRMFGKFQKGNTRCVCLYPCGHAFPVEKIDELMSKTAVDGFAEIQVKCCPLGRCRKPILYCPRYGQTIREYLYVIAEEHRLARDKRKTYVEGCGSAITDYDGLRSKISFNRDLSSKTEWLDFCSEIAESQKDRETTPADDPLLRLILECAKVHLQCLQLGRGCVLCKATPTQRCTCPTPLQWLQSLKLSSDAEKELRLRERYGVLDIVNQGTARLTPPFKPDDAVVKWYRCTNGHFVRDSTGKDPAELQCTKCLSDAPDELAEEERALTAQIGQRDRLLGRHDYDDFAARPRGRGRGRGGRGRGRGRRGRMY